jgi:hypothetical protein
VQEEDYDVDNITYPHLYGEVNDVIYPEVCFFFYLNAALIN